LLVHGRDHGGGHRTQERHPHAGFGAIFFRARIGAARRHLPRGPAKAAADPDDRAGHDLRNAAAGDRRRTWRAVIAALGDRGDRRRDGVDGFIAAGYAGAVLRPARERAVSTMPIFFPLTVEEIY